MMQFLVVYIHFIILAASLLVTGIAFLKSCSYSILRHLSSRTILAIAVLMQFLFAFLLSFLQYRQWSLHEIGRTLLSAPLPSQVPLGVFESLRSFFEREHGYFFFYAGGRFFLEIFILCLFTAVMVFLFSLWRQYEPHHFKKGDSIYLALALVLPGWPKTILVVPITLLALLLSETGKRLGFYHKTPPFSFLLLISSLLSIIFGGHLLQILNLYTLLAL